MSNCNNENLLGSFKKTGIQTNLKDALEDVGVKVPSTACLWEYPEIIRENLVSKNIIDTIDGINLVGKDIINIDQFYDDSNIKYTISTKYNTYGIDRPNYAPENDKWGKKLSVEETFNDLFNKVLPAVRGVYFADITETDNYGNDKNPWKHELFNESGNKIGLKGNSRYLRLYLTCQAEPLFVYIEDLNIDLSKIYNINNSDTIRFDIDDDLSLSAHIECITFDQIDAL